MSMKSLLPKLKGTGWYNFFKEEMKKKYWKVLEKMLAEEDEVFPPLELRLSVFEKCPLKKVKIIIQGQDPYHDDGQAMGISFSVPEGVKIPSSLRNIYNELWSDLKCWSPSHGDLSYWVNQGVLMFNASLTVRAHDANSHQKYWSEFSDNLIQYICEKRKNIVFILWGLTSQSKEKFITSGHHVIKSAHPSGLSAHKGFYGSEPFSRANEYLKQVGKKEIDWQITE